MPVNFEKPRILIVDDNSFIRELIKSFYDEYDFELIEAANGQQGVEMARAYTPDLILLDMQMPVLNGFEAAAILKNDDAVKSIPILVVTSQGREEVAKRLSGVYDGYVNKPFKKADLIDATLGKNAKNGCSEDQVCVSRIPRLGRSCHTASHDVSAEDRAA